MSMRVRDDGAVKSYRVPFDFVHNHDKVCQQKMIRYDMSHIIEILPGVFWLGRNINMVTSDVVKSYGIKMIVTDKKTDRLSGIVEFRATPENLGSINQLCTIISKGYLKGLGVGIVQSTIEDPTYVIATLMLKMTKLSVDDLAELLLMNYDLQLTEDQQSKICDSLHLVM